MFEKPPVQKQIQEVKQIPKQEEFKPLGEETKEQATNGNAKKVGGGGRKKKGGA